MRRILAISVLLVTVPSVPAADPKKDFFFHKGDRVMFLGDSITEQYQYSNYLELYLTTRFPTWGMQFLNTGIGGDTATGGANRFLTHVVAEKPTALTIDFGMNDGGYKEFNPNAAANFVRHTEAMVQMAKKAGIRVALISPNAVEVRNRTNLAKYLETQKRFYAPLKDIAAKNGLPFVDQYAVTRKVLEKLAADDAKVKVFPDAVHTNEAGGLLMAHTILVGLHAPALVSDATIDAAAKEAKTSNCAVSGIDGGADGIVFERTDEALPLPVIHDWRGLLPYIDDLKDLNDYHLKVTGLKSGKYTLLIDGKDVASFTDQQLAEGVNLGNLESGAIYEQGLAVLKAIAAKNEIVHGRFRQVMMYPLPDWLGDLLPKVEEKRHAELQKRLAVIEKKQEDVYALARPKAHKFELKAAK